jgi:hypothetical protein
MKRNQLETPCCLVIQPNQIFSINPLDYSDKNKDEVFSTNEQPIQLKPLTSFPNKLLLKRINYIETVSSSSLNNFQSIEWINSTLTPTMSPTLNNLQFIPSANQNNSNLFVQEVIDESKNFNNQTTLKINKSNLVLKKCVKFGNVIIDKLKNPEKYKRYREKNNEAVKKHRRKNIIEKTTKEQIYKEKVKENLRFSKRLNKLTFETNCLKNLILFNINNK